MVETWGEVISTIRIFIKAKNSFLWILNIKEYEIKKMVQEQWLQLKIKFLQGYNMKIVI